ncbi:ABC transporter ATP-binding protein [Treponema denticola]|uniref:ABC transporter ATP-binding protein n=1 Tax=Treponema denticola TaxID=158 RepID=A0A9Q9EWS6_TREDN|nr:ABC transporter ATP-binding protein [Treponema denticola]UTC90783.1 ABC transporter ATP-binding protein [Treponema denticola]UTC99865.1 ABC transporter ATP-binding protein [Treponema denticola]
MSNTVIKIEHLSKMYKLGLINNDALFRDIQSWWALKRGKEDPHGKIGADKYEGSDTEFWALKDLTFDIKQGDRVGIIGKNGAGKSTLLKVLSRITTPTEGSVKIRGKVSSLLEVGTGFHGELTGRENIYLNGAILGMKKAEIDRKLDEIIDFSGIEKHIDTPVKRYSSGMYVRLAFAVAAHLDSDILIADEVLAVGDSEFQKKAIGKMSELSTGQGRTVLFVSHNMAAVKSLCNKGIILEKGRLKFRSDDIDKAISYYLNIGEGGDVFLPSVWVNNGDFYNENFTPQKLEVVSMDNKSFNRSIYYNEAFKIRLTFDITELDRTFDFGIYIYMNTELLITAGGDGNLKNLKDKNNIYDFIVPARFFLPNHIYTVTVSSSFKERKWIINPDNNISTIIIPIIENDLLIHSELVNT